MESNEVEIEQDEEECQETEYNILPVQLVETYDNAGLSPPSNAANISKVKYYRQTYRPAWEQMPDFKGWLRGVEGEPTRAYCTYCHKSLHAHRLSLLKHTCTIRHQKAAQLHNSRKNKAKTMVVSRQGGDLEVVSPKIEDTTEIEEDIEYVEQELEENDSEHGNVEDEDGETEEVEYENIQKNYNQQPASSEKFPISTHVIDTTRGKPVVGLQVSLYKLIDGRWTYMNEGVTNSSGRFCHFLEQCDFTPGRYKLHYDVDRYFESRKQDTLYPFIEIVFDNTVCTETYHIPLMLSPYGYTTYRGS